MKQTFNYLFILLFAVSVGSITLAQNAPIDFEAGGNGAGWTWTTFANGTGGAMSVGENPSKTGINTSDSVAMLTTSKTGDPWAGYFSDDIGTFTVDATNCIVKVMVYKSVISNVTVKLEAGSPAKEIGIPNTKVDEWEEITYDFSSVIGSTYSRVTLFPDFTTRTQDNATYLDNVIFSALPEEVNVTFNVDMRLEIASGNFDKASDVVTVPGGFNNWLNEPPANSEKVLTDDDGDEIYSITIAMAPAQSYEYKYNIGTGWDGKDENKGNRKVNVGASDITLPTFFFNNYSPYTGVATEVTFNADMRLPIKQGNVVPGTSNVFVAGSFTDWGNGALSMTDDDGDSVYTVIADSITSGDILQYKYVYGDGAAASGTWEDGDNRRVGVTDTGNVVTRYWNDANPNITLADGDIVFTVDMSLMEELGLFDPNTDSTQIRGSFNGWSDGDASVSRLNQDFLNPNSWFLSIPFDNGVVGSEQFFKYFVTFEDTNKANMWSDGYERPLSQGGGNRDAIFEGIASQQEDVVYYDDVLPAYAILNDGVGIKFSVDMTDAANADLQVPTFNPANDKVYWISEQPAFVMSQGWVDSDTMKVLELTDLDGDMVYEATLNVKAPSWNGFVYRYAFVQGGTMTQEASGFGDFAYRVRYIEQAGYRKFVQPYAAPADSWLGDQEDKSSQSEAGPAGDITGVQELELVATSFKLEQNYPNPFNPTTQIRFSIPAKDVVTLKIYNVLGEEVKTLINSEMNSGSYEINFNASNLASGLYVYQLSTGNFVSNKKMMLLK